MESPKMFDTKLLNKATVSKRGLWQWVKEKLFSEIILSLSESDYMLMRKWKNGRIDIIETGKIKPGHLIPIPKNTKVVYVDIETVGSL